MFKLVKEVTKWNEDTGVSKVILFDSQNRKFEGMAQCHEDDKDFKSTKVGYEIAYRRAAIKYLKTAIIEVKASIKTIKELKNTFVAHPNLVEGRHIEIINKKIKNLEKELSDLTEEKRTITDDLQFMISSKDELYKKFRLMRKKKMG